MILHLKRFDFDMEALKRLKINDLYEFPMLLNMEPYTAEFISNAEQQHPGLSETPDADSPQVAASSSSSVGQVGAESVVDFASEDLSLIPEEKRMFWYRLVGVIVHTGTADSGHYYSFIRERAPRFSSDPRWLQFNDSNVDPFNPRDIAAECFGGADVVTSWDPIQMKSVPRWQTKLHSAYMLFYERVTRDPLQELEILERAMAYQNTEAVAPIVRSIRGNNKEFLRDKLICNEMYFQFLLEGFQKQWVQLHAQPEGSSFAAQAQHNVEGIVQSATHIFVNLLCHAKDRGQFQQWVAFLKEVYIGRTLACQWFLQTAIQENWLAQLLLHCYVREVQCAFAELLLFVIGTIRPVELSIYGQRSPSKRSKTAADAPESRKQRKIQSENSENVEEGEEEEDEVDESTDEDEDDSEHGTGGSLIKEVIHSLLALLEEAPQHWRHFETYFFTLYSIAQLGWEERSLFFADLAVGKLLVFYLGDDIPRNLLPGEATGKKKRRRKMGDKFTQPPLQDMLNLLALLITSGDSSLKRGSPSPLLLPGPNLVLTAAETKVLWCSTESRTLATGESSDPEELVFFYRQLKDAVNVEASVVIFKHLVWNNERYSKDLINVLMHGLDYLEQEHIIPFLQVFSELLELKDSLTDRVSLGIQSFIEVPFFLCFFLSFSFFLFLFSFFFPQHN